MHITTKALVLRGVDYKESDKVLTLLTQELGKVTASARGCRKKGSPIAAGCQLLCWSEMVLYEYQGRWAVKEAVTEREFRGVRDDLEKLALACYLAEVTEVLALEGLPGPELLSLILNSLHAMEKLDRPHALIKGAFELKAMCLAGYEPLLDGCAVCGADEAQQPRFHLQEGIVHCAACGEVGGSVPLDDGALKAMRHVAWGDPKRLFSIALGEESLKRFSAITEAYVQNQLDRGFHTLEFYKSLK